MTPVSAVIFDWGGTLTPWHTVDVPALWRHTYADAVHPQCPEAAASLAAILTDVDAQLAAQGRRDQRSASLEQVLLQASVRAGLEQDRLDSTAGREAYERAWEPYTFTDPAVGPLWTWLRQQGISVGVLSNTIWSRTYHRGLFARDGVLELIDGDVYTSEISVVKPHPDAFTAAALAVGAPVGECVYVGDRLYEDVWGPQQLGMRAIYLPHSDIPAEQLVDTDVSPDAVAYEWDDMVRILSDWIAAGREDAQVEPQ